MFIKYFQLIYVDRLPNIQIGTQPNIERYILYSYQNNTFNMDFLFQLNGTMLLGPNSVFLHFNAMIFFQY